MSFDRIIAPFVGPVSDAALAFPIAASLMALPFAIHHYRKHGRVHPFRAFLGYSFLYYLIAAFCLVVLPLPELPRGTEIGAWKEHYALAAKPRLDPSGFYREIVQARTEAGRSRALFQAVFNFLLLLPFGAYLVYLRRMRVLAAGLSGLLLSLGFELCQLTGDFWIYPGPYRLFDAGDLLLNSTGALTGALLAALLVRLRLLPDLDSLKGPDRPWIGLFRRGIAMAIDGAAASASALLIVAAGSALGLPSPALPAAAAGAFAVWLILLPAFDGGRGFGKRITFCEVARRKGVRAGFFRLLLRQGILWAPPLVLLGASGTSLFAGGGPASIAALGIMIVWLGLSFANLWGVAFGRERESWIDAKLDTRVRNTWKAPAEPQPTRAAKKPERPKRAKEKGKKTGKA